MTSKYYSLIILLIINLSAGISAQELQFNIPIKIDADPDKGFYWSYLMLIPEVKEQDELTFFVIPNNTGKNSDSIEVHEKAAYKTVANGKLITEHLNCVVLVPIFPRGKTDWKVYTHALDRDVMIRGMDSIGRLDLQLIAMLEDAAERLKLWDIVTREKIFMLGFSASGMFVNRFTLLHPEKVIAAAIGSPGGWPMVPVEKYENAFLNYPVGINDYKEISGKSFNSDELKKVKLFFFLGDKDENDSVVFDDSYDEAERKIILESFGENLQKRWAFCKELYKQNDYKNASFTLYKDVGHTINNLIVQDILNFFKTE